MKDKYDKSYYNCASTSSFGGVSRLHLKHNKDFLVEIQKYLQSQDAYTKHKFTRNKFVRRKVSAPYKNYLWAADLIHMQKYSKANKGFKFILTVIDIASRYGYAVCVKNKSGPAVTEAFMSIINEQSKPR